MRGLTGLTGPTGLTGLTGPTGPTGLIRLTQEETMGDLKVTMERPTMATAMVMRAEMKILVRRIRTVHKRSTMKESDSARMPPGETRKTCST
jgi:hypothetical protein